MAWSGKDFLLHEYLPRFVSDRRCRESLERYISTARVLDDQRARDWLDKDLARDQELAAISDPENLALEPSKYVLPADAERGYVARGDLHDWTNIEHETVTQHASHCPRCQLGIKSRTIVDERAKRLGKRPFPNWSESVTQPHASD